MNELTAAIARSQIGLLEERGEQWNARYATLAVLLGTLDHVRVPQRDPREHYIASSIQFSLVGLSATQIAAVIDNCRDRGVDIKWFGRPQPQGFTATFEHWRYFDPLPHLSETHRILQGLCDMRIPLSLTEDDCHLIADIVAGAIRSQTNSMGNKKSDL